MPFPRWTLHAAFCALATLSACSAGNGGSGIVVDDDAPEDTASADAADDTADDAPRPSFDVPPTCSAPLATCAGACVDTRTDALNCGACGRACTASQSCSNGACVGTTPTCAAPRALCGTSCVDTLSDRANCGACGRACPSDQTCNDGSCRASTTTTCAAPLTACGTSCVNTLTDAANCGGCGIRCAAGQTCSAGGCLGSSACPTGQTRCGSVCVNTLTDPANCGFCDVRCTAGQTCTDGLCFSTTTCASPRVMCGTSCTDPQSDTTNCGSCGNRCLTGQTCTAGRCITPTTSSRAGAPCTMPDPMGGLDPACGALVCVPTGTTPMCTDACTNSPSQATEQAMCGGAGSTCLTQGDGADASSICVSSCRVTGTSTATGACRAGFVCTGWWFTHDAGPDATGCFPFCTNDAQCPTGSRCNTRTGDCDTTGVVSARLPDGAPCNPTITTTVPGETTPRNTQCRGICWTIGTATQGICGSLLDLRTSMACPDTPTLVAPRGVPSGDNLAVCLFKDCTRNAGCTAPLVCRRDESATGVVDTASQPTCQYPTRAQPAGIP